jgi:hypothetical protein
MHCSIPPPKCVPATARESLRCYGLTDRPTSELTSVLSVPACACVCACVCAQTFASLAACLTILSYVATGVVSGADACSYLARVWTSLDVFAATIVLLCVFAALNLMGISESAVVAAIIFGMHITTMLVLIIAGIVQMGKVRTHHTAPHSTPPIALALSDDDLMRR